MKKIIILLLTLSLLLCAFASCEQPDVPPSESSDSDSGSEGEGETDALPDGSIVISASEWDTELKKLWDSFLAGEFGEAESITSEYSTSYQSFLSPFYGKTDSENSPTGVDVLKENAGIFSTPVKVETVINGTPTEAFVSPLGASWWQFHFELHTIEVIFLRAPALQTGDTDVYFITLTITQYPNPLSPDVPSITQYSTTFQVTEAQCKALLQAK